MSAEDDAEAHDAVEYVRALARYEELTERRRQYFTQPKVEATKERNRMFIISDDKPWCVFGRQSVLQVHRFVFERCGLQMTALHRACAQGDLMSVRTIAQRQQCCFLARDGSGRIPLHHAVVHERSRVIKWILGHRRDAKLQVHARDFVGMTPVHLMLDKLRVKAQKTRVCTSQHEPLPARAFQLKRQSRAYSHLWKRADEMIRLVSPSLKSESIDRFDRDCRGDEWDAVRYGDCERLRFLQPPDSAQSRRMLKSLMLSELRWTLLHEACDRRQSVIINYLINEVGVDRLSADASGATPFHYAAMRGFFEGCVLFLDQQFSVGTESDEIMDTEVLHLAQDNRGRTPLVWSMLSPSFRSSSHTSLIKYLVRRCPSSQLVQDADGFTALHYAIWRGSLELVKEFVALGANVNTSTFSLGVWSPSPEFLPDSSGVKFKRTATWAPCGERFRRRLLSTSTQGEAVNDSNQEVSAADGEDNDIVTAQSRVVAKRMHGIDEGIVIRRDTLWYWIPSFTKRNFVLSKREKLTSKRSLNLACMEGNDYGCRRYGGVCQSCFELSMSASPPVSFNSKVRHSVIMPLPLAIRRSRVGKSAIYVAVIKFLLNNGALLNGDTNGKTTESPLSEAVKGAADGFEVLELVLLHGAKRMNGTEVENFCSSTIRSQNAEAAVARLFEFIDIGHHLLVVCLLFTRGWLGALDCILDRMDHLSPSGPSRCADGDEHVIEETSIARTWKKIADFMCAMRQLPPKTITAVHLNYLLAVANGVHDDNNACDAWNQLMLASFQYFVRDRRNQVHVNDDDEALLIRCENRYSQNLKCELRMCTLELVYCAIESGFFKLAQNLLEKRFISSPTSILDIDGLLRSCLSAMRADRRGLIEFIAIVFQHMEKSGVMQFSALALAMAAHLNLPLALFEKVANTLAIMLGSIKVRSGGKTLTQWIIHHDREDLWACVLSRCDDIAALWARCVCDANVTGSSWRTRLLSEEPQWQSDEQKYGIILQLFASVAIRQDDAEVAKFAIENMTSRISIVEILLQSDFVTLCCWYNAPKVLQYIHNHAAVSAEVWMESILGSRSMISEDCEMHVADVCRLLGHHKLASIWATYLCDGPNRASPAQPLLTPLDYYAADILPEALPVVGLFNLIISNSSSVPPLLSQHRGPLSHINSVGGCLRTALLYNQVPHVHAIAECGFPFPVLPNDESLVTELLLECGRGAALETLQVLCEYLDSSSERGCLSMMTINSAQTIWSSIAKHSSARYGDIVSLLLKHGLPRGRLAGDGVETTLMHYAATLEDPVSSSQIITSLLECDGGDINVPDAFGNTPITYSLASGRLQQACDILLLETTPRARLEAEFEGQSMFYYTLQLLPSLSWRLLLQQLLIRMRNRAFLHCVAEDGCCACKSFESPDSEREHQESESECTFCCHQASYHTRVPFPPWFTDQYETYLGIASDHTSPRNDDEYQFTESNSKGTREEEIENTRGRLDNSALRLVTAARYGDLIRSFGLFGECHEAESSGAIPAEDINEQVMPSKKRRSKPNWNTTWDTPTSAWAMTTTGETKVDENPNPAIETSGSTEADESNLPSCAHFRVLRQPVPMLQCRSLPQSYRCELKAIHSATCTCFKPELFVSPEQVQYATICRWLRTDTSNQLGSLTSQQSDLDKLKNAWKRWHDHTRSSIQVCSQVPVDGLPELDGAQRKHRHRQLRAYLLHWRSALLFQAFFRWKHSNQSYGLMHHNVETVADQLSDVKRLIRRKELQRQHLQMVQAVATFNARHQRHRHVVAD